MINVEPLLFTLISRTAFMTRFDFGDVPVCAPENTARVLSVVPSNLGFRQIKCKF